MTTKTMTKLEFEAKAKEINEELRALSELPESIEEKGARLQADRIKANIEAADGEFVARCATSTKVEIGDGDINNLLHTAGCEAATE